jgi:general stress protein CsbA
MYQFLLGPPILVLRFTRITVRPIVSIAIQMIQIQIYAFKGRRFLIRG